MPLAAADEPIEFTVDFVIPGIDPCTGQLHVVSITREFSLHLHDPMPFIVRSTGETTSGYELNSSVINGNTTRDGLVRHVVSDQWRHPDGRKYHVLLKYDLDPITFERLNLKATRRCLGS